MLAALSTPIWGFATAETWWLLFAGYLFWGLYAVANIAQLQLAWKHSPHSDNQSESGLSRQTG